MIPPEDQDNCNGFIKGVIIGLIICIPFWYLIFKLIF